MTEDRWLWMKDITKYLGATRETIVKWIETKKKPGHRVSTCWNYQKPGTDVWRKFGPAASTDDSGSIL